MDFSNPVKSKKIFILMLILVVIFFAGAGVLGYFFYQKIKSYKNLDSEKQKLEEQVKSASVALQKQIKDLKEDKSDLEKDKKTLESQVAKLEKDKKTLTDQITADEKKIGKAKAYLATLNYVNDLIIAHEGLMGWTEEEFQEARRLAGETKNSAYVDLVDWCWTREDIGQVVRFTRLIEETLENVENNLP